MYKLNKYEVFWHEPKYQSQKFAPKTAHYSTNLTALKKSGLIRVADPGAKIGSHDLSPTETGK